MSVDPLDAQHARRPLKSQLPILLPSLDQLFSHYHPFNSGLSSSSSSSNGSSRSMFNNACKHSTSSVPHMRASLASYKTCNNAVLPPIPAGQLSGSPPTFNNNIFFNATRNSRSKSLGTIELPPIRSMNKPQLGQALPPLRSEFVPGYSSSSNNNNNLQAQQQAQQQVQPQVQPQAQYVDANSTSASLSPLHLPALSNSSTDRHASISSITSSSVFGSESPSPGPPNAYYPTGYNNIYSGNMLKKTRTNPETVYYEPSNPEPNNIDAGAASTLLSLKQKKRRQRTGPSCDSCRVRKVKCDAEIIILKELATNMPDCVKQSNSDTIPIKKMSRLNPKDFNLSETKLKQIYRDNGLGYSADFAAASEKNPAEEPLFIQTPTKLVRFKSCSACRGRNADCNFSKGYTRAEILKFNRCRKVKSHKKTCSSDDEMEY